MTRQRNKELKIVLFEVLRVAVVLCIIVQKGLKTMIGGPGLTHRDQSFRILKGTLKMT